MPFRRLLLLFTISSILLFNLTRLNASSALESHEHGHSILNLIAENDQLYIEFESPAVNIIGFEHSAETDDQQAAIDAAKARLVEFASLFEVSAESNCKLMKQSADWVLHAEVDDHAEFHASYQLNCDIAKLKSINLPIFDHFPGIEEIEAQVLLSSKQLAFELDSQNRIIQLQ